MFRDSRLGPIGGGTSEILREIIAKMVIDGKDYKRSELSTKTYNSIIVRQDLQATKIKLSLELEKIAILQAHYDNAIAKELGIEIKKDEPNSSSTGAVADKK